MPHISSLIDDRGPVVQVRIATTLARSLALQAAGMDVPNFVTATLLIDTGASNTCICTSVVEKLGLQPTGSVGLLTPSTGNLPYECATYDVDFHIPAMQATKHIPAIPVIAADFSSQDHQGLMGRDLLKDFRFIYSGPDKLIMLSY